MLYDRGDVFQISTFFTVMQETIEDPVKSLWWSAFAKIVNRK